MSDIFSRGGMCANPFGGEDRIDRINLLEYLQPNQPAEKVLFSRVIQDAVSNYLYAFLGKNGTSAEEFFAAWQYFFKVVSTDRKSWDHHRTIKHTYTRQGKKITVKRELTDGELQLMCFDKHYALSGLNEHMNVDRFRSQLKAKRLKIVTNNWEQIAAYVDALYQRELSQIADGQPVPLQVWKDDLLTILVDPPTPMHLASVIYVPSKLKRPRRSRAVKPGVGKYAQLVKRIESGIHRPLGNNWGPLAMLLGAEYDQTVDDNSNSSICSNNGGPSIATPSSNGG